MTAEGREYRRERLLVAAGVAAMAALAWVYVWQGAGMGGSALDMTRLSLFPHLEGEGARAATMRFPWVLVVAMWWTMMIAMMTPSAAPLLLLFGRVHRHHRTAGGSVIAATVALAAGYLAVWFAYSVAAAGLQGALQSSGLVSGMMLWSRSELLSAAVLAAAGVYQLTPLKQACLAQCRSPVQFLTRYWRPGHAGAFAMGVRHGAYCVGCCWMLMALLFVGGVMNLAWIAALTLLVLVEKLAPAGEIAGRLSGGVLIAWAAATLWV